MISERRCVSRALLAVLCFSSLWRSDVFGQSSVTAGKVFGRYQQQVWRDQDGLPQNTVLSIAQSADGYLWLGTMGGVARFDGVNFTAFNDGNTPELRSGLIDAVIPEADGSVWIGTEAGLVRREADGRFIAFTEPKGIGDSLATRLERNNTGELWIGKGGGGFFRWHKGRFEVLTLGLGPGADAIHCLIDDGNGGLWLGTDAGLVYRKDGQSTLYTTAQGLPSGYIRTLCRDRDGNLWLGTMGGGLARFRDGTFTTFGAREGLPSDQVWALLLDRDGSLWVGTGGAGVFRMRDGKFSAFNSGTGLPGDRVCSLFQSAEGDIWIGTDGGLSRLRESRFQIFTTEDGLANDFALAIYEDRAGDLWAGTTKGVTRYRDGAATTFTTANGQPLGEVSAIAEDAHGGIWIGAGNGLNQLRDEVFVPVSIRPDAPTALISCIHSGGDGKLVVATRGAGVWVRDGEQWKPFALPNEWSRTDVTAFYEDGHGDLWAGSLDGSVGRRRDEQWQVWTTRDGLPGDYVYCFYEDPAGGLWIGTRGGGLRRWKDGRWTAVTARQGLFDNLAFQMLPDDEGNIWISCNRGLFRVALSELNDCADGRLAAVTSYAYGMTDGMPTRECNGSQPGGCRTRDGRLFFPTTRGMISFAPRRPAMTPPMMKIEQVQLDRVAASSASSVRVRANQRDVEIQYTALSWNRPPQIQFKYRMEGLDNMWTEAGTRRTAYYSHLPPGAYTFRVKADNGDGVWSLNDATVAIVVSPPFWRTWWFVSLGVLVLVSAVAGLFRFRVNQLQRRQAVQEDFSRGLLAAHESERRRIAAELHDSLGQHLVMIKSSAVRGAQTAQNAERAQTQFAQITEQSASAISEVREIAYNLRPYLLDQFGLSKAISALLEQIASTTALEVRAEVDDVSGLFSAETEMSIYRIVQESLNNILKHAEAKKIELALKKSGTEVRLEIRDDGKGFEPRAASGNGERRGFGLLGVSERVRLLGGVHELRSSPGAGTTVLIHFELAGAKL